MYKPAGPGGDRAATFALKSGVGVYGGFAGTRRSSGDIAASPTILSGDLNGDDGPDFANMADNSPRRVRGQRRQHGDD
jgi:hypothetical protein